MLASGCDAHGTPAIADYLLRLSPLFPVLDEYRSFIRGGRLSTHSAMIRRRGIGWRENDIGATLAQWLSPAPPGASWGK